jgi:citrate lyase alpha subunit
MSETKSELELKTQEEQELEAKKKSEEKKLLKLKKLEEKKIYEKEQKKKKKEEKKKEEKTEVKEKKEEKKETGLKMKSKKEEQFSEWYREVIKKSELIEYYEISGCYIFRPWSYKIWELIQQFIDKEIKKLGVENCYFPLFVSKRALESEKDHIEGFAPGIISF